MKLKIANIYQRNYLYVGLAATFVLAFVITICMIQIQPNKVASSKFFVTCTEAKLSGKTPLTRSDPGYRLGLDKDRDGLACE